MEVAVKFVPLTVPPLEMVLPLTVSVPVPVTVMVDGAVHVTVLVTDAFLALLTLLLV